MTELEAIDHQLVDAIIEFVKARTSSSGQGLTYLLLAYVVIARNYTKDPPTIDEIAEHAADTINSVELETAQ